MRVFEKNSTIFNLLSEAGSEGILVIDEEQIIVSVSTRINNMFGCVQDALKGQSLNILIPEAHQELYKNISQNFIEHMTNEEFLNVGKFMSSYLL